jgi:hypothetical protein
MMPSEYEKIDLGMPFDLMECVWIMCTSQNPERLGRFY